MEQVAPGVIGYLVEHDDGSLYVPLIAAVDEGRGDVGRFLDSLPTDRRVVVPNVLNDILAGMLKRRGFKNRMEMDEDGPVAVWARRASTSQ